MKGPLMIKMHPKWYTIAISQQYVKLNCMVSIVVDASRLDVWIQRNTNKNQFYVPSLPTCLQMKHYMWGVDLIGQLHISNSIQKLSRFGR